MHVGVWGTGTSKIEVVLLRRHSVTHMNAVVAESGSTHSAKARPISDNNASLLR